MHSTARLLQAKKALNVHGIETFKQKITNLESGALKTPAKLNSKPVFQSKAKQNLLMSEDFKTIKRGIESSEKKPQEEKGVHPKLIKLLEIIKEHKRELQTISKAIIFTSLKDSVYEIVDFVNTTLNGELELSAFTGQDKEFSKKHQMHTIDAFRNGDKRVLVSTSVGEEGLDIGEVDIIICYDVASTNPIRTIQRFGRTGRKRSGKVYVFLGKGEETSKFYAAKRNLKKVSEELQKAALNPGSRLELNHPVFQLNSFMRNETVFIEREFEEIVSESEEQEEIEEELQKTEIKQFKKQPEPASARPIENFFKAATRENENNQKFKTEVKPKIQRNVKVSKTNISDAKGGFSFVISKTKTGSGNKYETEVKSKEKAVESTSKKQMVFCNPFKKTVIEEKIAEEIDFDLIDEILGSEKKIIKDEVSLSFLDELEF